MAMIERRREAVSSMRCSLASVWFGGVSATISSRITVSQSSSCSNGGIGTWSDVVVVVVVVVVARDVGLMRWSSRIDCCRERQRCSVERGRTSDRSIERTNLD